MTRHRDGPLDLLDKPAYREVVLALMGDQGSEDHFSPVAFETLRARLGLPAQCRAGLNQKLLKLEREGLVRRQEGLSGTRGGTTWTLTLRWALMEQHREVDVARLRKQDFRSIVDWSSFVTVYGASGDQVSERLHPDRAERLSAVEAAFVRLVELLALRDPKQIPEFDELQRLHRSWIKREATLTARIAKAAPYLSKGASRILADVSHDPEMKRIESRLQVLKRSRGLNDRFTIVLSATPWEVADRAFERQHSGTPERHLMADGAAFPELIARDLARWGILGRPPRKSHSFHAK